MVHGPASGPQVQHGGQSTGEIFLRQTDGFLEGKALGQVGGDGAGKRASGAVGIGVIDAAAVKPVILAVMVEKVVGVGETVAAFAEDGAALDIADLLCRRLHILFGADSESGEDLGFRNVGSDDRGDRQKLRL